MGNVVKNNFFIHGFWGEGEFYTKICTEICSGIARRFAHSFTRVRGHKFFP